MVGWSCLALHALPLQQGHVETEPDWWDVCWSHIVWKNPEVSSAQCQLRIYRCLCNIPPRNLEPCFLQTLFFNNHFVLLWANACDGYRITEVTECSKTHWLWFQCDYMAIHSTRKLSLASTSIQADLLLVPQIIAYSILCITVYHCGNCCVIALSKYPCAISLKNTLRIIFLVKYPCATASRNIPA